MRLYRDKKNEIHNGILNSILLLTSSLFLGSRIEWALWLMSATLFLLYLLESPVHSLMAWALEGKV